MPFLFFSESKLVSLCVVILILMGINASVPNANENGVFPVGVHIMVWYAQRTLKSSSGQRPLELSSLFLIMPKIILFVTSTWLLAWG